ncbi:iron-sulfur cluster biosynthesis family protein [Alkalicoccus daliensis]|uniref:Uncharacterized protein YqkB n=1 Tax=Alkalicoccus daliensis TaxID=745820 RepID=A0A1H0B9S6_9BACI|nr:iron-sulfur cluster biosynthesis family protein [Alkalicoccus daliensis]SDN42113.1 Uncharacterized protein YqkB [Alkalicoccus daliensis]
MKVEITNAALEKLSEMNFPEELNVLFISHETAGTGCVVNGVSDLVLTSESQLPQSISFIETNADSFLAALDSRVDWIYEENMKIDYNEKAGAFQLSSPAQMLNPRMKVRSAEKV